VFKGKLTEKQKLDFIESVWGYVEVVEFFTLSGLPGNPRGTRKIERCSPTRAYAINRAYIFAKQESGKKSGKKSTR
jgi:hypothetical protein